MARRDRGRCRCFRSPLRRLLADASIVRVKLSGLRAQPATAVGACWLALTLWRELQLDLFWSGLLGVSRKGTRWGQVLFVLVAYRLLAPGSECACTVSGSFAARRRPLGRGCGAGRDPLSLP